MKMWRTGMGLRLARMFQRNLRIGMALMAVACFMVACEDDQNPLPAYVQTLADLETDWQGTGQTLVLEDGSRHAVLNPVADLPADTLMRVYALLQMRADKGGVLLSALQPVASPQALIVADEEMRTDPVQMISIWKTGHRWVNLHLGVLSGGGTHVCGFAEKWVPATDSVPARVYLTLYHDRADDPEYYTESAYLSCPVRHYADSLRIGVDSVVMRVHTYQGWVERSFLY